MVGVVRVNTRNGNVYMNHINDDSLASAHPNGFSILHIKLGPDVSAIKETMVGTGMLRCILEHICLPLITLQTWKGISK